PAPHHAEELEHGSPPLRRPHAAHWAYRHKCTRLPGAVSASPRRASMVTRQDRPTARGGVHAMGFGIFHEFSCRPGRCQAGACAEGCARAAAAGGWGREGVWLAGLHFTPERSVLSSPLTLASAIAARTSHIKVGTAVQVLPLADPLRLAEETATVD